MSKRSTLIERADYLESLIQRHGPLYLQKGDVIVEVTLGVLKIVEGTSDFIFSFVGCPRLEDGETKATLFKKHYKTGLPNVAVKVSGDLYEVRIKDPYVGDFEQILRETDPTGYDPSLHIAYAV